MMDEERRDNQELHLETEQSEDKTRQQDHGGWEPANQKAWEAEQRASQREEGPEERGSQREEEPEERGSQREEEPEERGSQREEEPEERGSQREEEPEERGSQGAFESQSENGGQFQGDTEAREPLGAKEQRQPQQNVAYIPAERPRKPRSGGSLGGKIAGVAAAAVLFGIVAGGTMLAVSSAGRYVTERYLPQPQPERVSVAKADTSPVNPSENGTGGAGGTASAAGMTDVSAIVEMAMPSVVAINSTMLTQQQTWFGPGQTIEVPSSGSGIIVGQNQDELLIVTNNHVVADSTQLSVVFIDNQQVNAAIKGTDSDSDLAVIAVKLGDIPEETKAQIKIATMGDSDALKVGQGVVAIGNALGYGQSVTVGYVSALNREVKTDDSTTKNLLQTDAAINPGNSGGALLNMKGEVIGINAAKYSSTEVEGIGYAIPISQVQDVINSLMNVRTRTEVDPAHQGYLGIQGQNIDETAAAMYGMPRGVYVYKIMDGSAASQSDLREKDIITKFDGQSVRTMAELKELLTYYKGGDQVDLTVQSLENGQYVERTVSVTLGTKPAENAN